MEEGTRYLNDVVLEKLGHHGELRLGVKDCFSFKAQLLVLIGTNRVDSSFLRDTG